MKKLIMLVLVSLILLQSVAAMSASDAKQEWLDAKQVSREKQQTYRDAKADLAAENNEDNRQAVVDTGKDVLNAALDEAELWLKWKDVEAEENSEVPEDIKQAVFDDVAKNLEKIDGLRVDVDNVDNQLELGLVFLKIIGKYFELVADVARNSGAMWVHIADDKANTIEDFEQKLRDSTEDEEVIGLLDDARDELNTARRNIDNAEDTYKKVKLPGQPMIKFSEANNYLRSARANMMSAHRYLNQAYRAMVR